MRKQIPLLKKAGAFALSLGLMFTLVSPYAIYAEEEGTVTPQTEETNTQEQVEEKENTLETPSTRSFDVNKPVIESIDIVDYGKLLKPGDEITIYVKAYDLDSKIQSVNYTLYYYDDEEMHTRYESVIMEYNEELEVFIGKTIVRNGYKNIAITDIEAEDTFGNYTNKEVYSEDGQYLYTFKVQGEMIENGKVIDLKFDKNGSDFYLNDKGKLSITVSSDSYKDTDYIYAEFKNEQYSYSHNFTLFKDPDNQNTYSGEIESYDLYPGEYFLCDIYSYRDDDFVKYDYSEMNSIHFNSLVEKDTEAPKIINIDIDKKQEILKSGDTISIRIKAIDNMSLKKGDAYVEFSPIEDVRQNIKIDLRYDDNKNEFLGEKVLTDSIYPCEWILTNVDIRDLSDNIVNLEDFNSNIYNNNPYYFMVENDGTYTAPKYDLNISFNTINKYGEYTQILSYDKENVERRTTYKEANISFPDGSTNYDNLKFMGWVDYEGNFYDENTEVLNDTYETLFAIYDKQIVDYEVTYVDETDTIKTVYDKKVIPFNMKFGDFFKNYIPNVSDMNKEQEFDSWNYTFDNEPVKEDDVIPFSPWRSIEAKATFKDKVVFEGQHSYFDTNADYAMQHQVLFMPKGTYRSEAVKLLGKTTDIEFYPGLRFIEWFDSSDELDGFIENYETISVNAKYENNLIRFVIFDEESAKQGVFKIIGQSIELAENGDIVSIPNFDGLEKINWFVKPEEEIIVDGSRNYTGYSSIKPDTPVTPDQPDEPDTPVTPDTPDTPVTPEEPEKPVTPDKPVTPEEPEKPITPDKPSEPDKEINKDTSGTITDKVIVLPKEETNKIVEEIAKADKEEKIEVFMGNATVVPTEVLEAAKGKDVVVELNMGGYTWEINGKDILASNLKDINLEVKMDSNAVPTNIVKELAGDNPVKQLSLTHNGNFGFKADLKINVGNENKGKYGNLYYYDSDGKMVYMNAGKIDENGNVVVSFSHASDYVIVINDKVMAPSTNNKDVIKDTANHVNNVYGFISISLCISGAFMLLYANKRKSEE